MSDGGASGIHASAGAISVIFGILITVLGSVMYVGEWRAHAEAVDQDHERRIEKVEDQVGKNTAALISIQSDVRYLAERARKQDGDR